MVGWAYEKIDEGLKRDIPVFFGELFMYRIHILVLSTVPYWFNDLLIDEVTKEAHRINDTKTCKSSSHLGDTKGIVTIPVEVPERALELLKLSRSKIRHIPRHDLPVVNQILPFSLASR